MTLFLLRNVIKVGCYFLRSKIVPFQKHGNFMLIMKMKIMIIFERT